MLGVATTDSELPALRPLRIGFLTEWFDPEPAPVPGLSFATWLADRGHTIRVLTTFPNYPGGRIYPGYTVRPHYREMIGGVEVHRVPVFPSHDGSGIQRVLTYSSFALSAAVAVPLVLGDMDVLYVYHPPGTIAIPALVGRCVLRKRYVLHVQDMWPESIIESGMVKSPWARTAVRAGVNALCRPMYRCADTVVAQSAGFQTLLAERGASAESTTVVYNWTDEKNFFPAKRDDQLAADLEIEGTFNIIYAGNLGPFQGLDVAVEAARLVEHLVDFRLVIIGTGQCERELRAQARGVRTVKFIDRLRYDRMNGVYQLADALLVTLEDRAFFRATVPSKTQVALAVGRPIVAALAGDGAELVRKAGAGIVCRPGVPVEMARAFESMYLLGSHERAAMGARGREFYERELSLGVGAARLESALMAAAVRGDRCGPRTVK